MITLRVHFLLQPYLSGTSLIWILETQAASTFLKNLLSFTQLFAKSIIFDIQNPYGIKHPTWLHLQPGTQFLKPWSEIKQNWIGRENFDICLLRDFWPPVPKLYFLKEDLVLGSATPIFEIFSIFPNFLRF